MIVPHKTHTRIQQFMGYFIGLCVCAWKTGKRNPSHPCPCIESFQRGSKSMALGNKYMIVYLVQYFQSSGNSCVMTSHQTMQKPHIRTTFTGTCQQKYKMKTYLSCTMYIYFRIGEETHNHLHVFIHKQLCRLSLRSSACAGVFIHV